MDALFNLHKIKFEKLDELLNQGNEITEESTINIYFNLESIWKLAINIKGEQTLRAKKNTRIIEMAANIVNIAAHYRLWCKKHKLASRVILYTPSFDKLTYKNTVFNKKYRLHTLLKYNEDSNCYICQETIREAIQMAKTILEYIDGVYLIESYDVEPSLIPLICDKKFEGKNINFIVSTDHYDFQYSNFGFYVFRPKKEESFLIRKGELINTVKALEGIKNETKVSDDLYSFVLAILGDRNRSISKIKNLGLSTVLTLISKAIDNHLISDTTRSIEMLIKSLKEEHRVEVLNNFYCTDLEFQYSSLQSSSRLQIEYQIKDRFDMDSLIKLNNSYFNDTPLQLLEVSPEVQQPVKKEQVIKRNPF